MHLRDRHEHAIGTRIREIEIILRRAQDRFGAQPDVLPDAVHRVHDVIADAQIGQRNRDALFDRAQFDAFGRCAEDLAIAEHAQTQIGNAKPASIEP